MIPIFATACGTGNPTVATTSPTPAAILDDHYGFIVGNTVRLESDAKPNAGPNRWMHGYRGPTTSSAC